MTRALRVDPGEIAARLRGVLAAIAAGDLDASADYCARLEGAVMSLDLMAGTDAPTSLAGLIDSYAEALVTKQPFSYSGSMARTRKSAPVNTCIGYTRVSTDEQAASGAGLDAQRNAIAAEATRRGWTVVAWHTDEGVSGSKPADDRPAGHAALETMRNRDAATLLVAKSDRLTRSVLDLAGLVDRADREGWELTACDNTIDTSTPAGRFTTTIMGGVAELEREQIGARTREALAARRAAGVRLGRPSVLTSEIVGRIVSERQHGVTLWAIANGLTADGIPTARGNAQWKAASVRKVLLGQDAANLIGLIADEGVDHRVAVS